MADLQALTAAIGRATAPPRRVTGEAIDRGLGPQTILDAMTAAMATTGARFSETRSTSPRC
jgi:hypothetical protein